MAQTTVDGVEGVQGLVGEHLGHSDWVEVTQQQVDQFAEATGDHQDLGEQRHQERQRQVAVGDRAAERALPRRPLRVDMDPLVVAGGLGEPVHLLLGDLHPVAVAQVLPDQALDPLDPVDRRLRHQLCLLVNDYVGALHHTDGVGEGTGCSGSVHWTCQTARSC